MKLVNSKRNYKFKSFIAKMPNTEIVLHLHVAPSTVTTFGAYLYEFDKFVPLFFCIKIYTMYNLLATFHSSRDNSILVTCHLFNSICNLLIN